MFCSQFDTNLAPIPWTKYVEEIFGGFFTPHLLSDITPLYLIVDERVVFRSFCHNN